MLVAKLELTTPMLFGDNQCQPAVIEKTLPYHYILSLRLEGRCSVEAISTIMKRFNIGRSSIGTISEFLHYIGSLLPDTLTTNGEQHQVVVFLSDELFSKSIPILVTVEPISSAILKIELADSRKVEDWKKHWECLQDNGYCALYLVCDEGKALCEAQKEALADIFRQPDTYHAIAHRLGIWVRIFEQAAYSAIKEEYRCKGILNSAKSEEVINKRAEKYEQAKQITNEKIELYENYYFLYGCLIKELQIFDDSGNLRDRKQAEENIEAALELLETLKNEKLIETVHKVRRTMPSLLNYFDVAISIVGELTSLPIDQQVLQLLCLAWQWGKTAVKSKKAKKRQYYSKEADFYLELAQVYLQEHYDFIKEKVYKELDQIIQSSSLVECINSIIRPYLNTSKNQITQETLNLIMHYHNHRRYKDGKREGKIPYEILTGKSQEKDWIELLFDLIKEKDPAFLTRCR
jgi:hypothetical protein